MIIIYIYGNMVWFVPYGEQKNTMPFYMVTPPFVEAFLAEDETGSAALIWGVI